jgi:hypothetical protein
MVVKVSKPELNLREKISELDKPSGVAGEAMLRAETPQEQFNLIGAGRRNLLINGDFQVSQRGDFTSSQTLGTSFQYYVDRWRIYAFNNDLGYIQHFLDQSLPDGSYANTLRITSGDSDLLAPLVQHVENHKIVWGRDFTFSFWYKSTSDNMYNLWNGTSQVHFLLPDTAGTWVKFEKTFKFKENGAQLRIEYYSHTATFHSGAYLELANLQLELGKVATPFEHRSYGEELALCQRYYEEGLGYWNAAPGYMRMYMPFTVQKRAAPTVNVYSSVGPSGLPKSGTINQFYQGGQSKASMASSKPTIYSYRADIDINAFTSNQDIYWGWTAEAEL